MADLDAIVVGGGPAGCAAALALSRAGWRTAVLDRPRRSRPATIESLPAAALPLLERLGLRGEFLADGHPQVRANRSCWAGPQPLERPALLDAYGQGWHLDRARFDAMLRQGVLRAGVSFLEARVAATSYQQGAFGVELTSPGGDRAELRARGIVDATGRGAAAARALGARLVCAQRLIAVCAQSVRSASSAESDAVSFVEATQEGWWYSAPTRAGPYAVQFFTQPALWRKSRDIAAHLRLAPLTSERVGALSSGAPRVCSARSAYASPCAGPGWVAVGDAACAYDPLAASGLMMALRSGLRAAHALACWLSEGQTSALDRYARMQRAAFDRYWVQRMRLYALERRWPRSPFWAVAEPACAFEL